jgi:transposase
VIVIGVDPHKQTHTGAAVEAATGVLVGERTVSARQAGHEQLLVWARELGGERLWALGDCRHVSGALERCLLARGERVLRVPPRLMGQARQGCREQGKSDSVDALAVARAALREPDLPVARLAGPEREIRLSHDHRADLVAERTRIQNRLRWHLHDLAVTQGRVHAPARAYLARKQAEGKSRIEALRCLKRHLARVVYRILTTIAARRPAPTSTQPRTPNMAAGLT